MKHTFTQKDKLTLEEWGISESDAQEQLYLLQNGANYAHLERPATQDDGINLRGHQTVVRSVPETVGSRHN